MKNRHIIVIVVLMLLFLGNIGEKCFAAVKPDAKTLWTNPTPANRLEPGGSKKNVGYVAGERPGFKTWNWLIYTLGLWTDYYEPVTDLLQVSTDTAGGYIGQRGSITIGKSTDTITAGVEVDIVGDVAADAFVNSTNTVINADFDGDSTGEIQFQIGGSTVAKIDNAGKATFNNEVTISSNVLIDSRLDIGEDTSQEFILTAGTSTTDTYDFAISTNGEFFTSYGFFHDRGDPSGFDFSQGDLITDGNWYDLDLSSIVPVGTKTILLRVDMRDTGVQLEFRLRENGNSNIFNMSAIFNQVSNFWVQQDMIVSCDSNRIIEYWATNTTFDNIDIVVSGWWK